MTTIFIGWGSKEEERKAMLAAAGGSGVSTTTSVTQSQPAASQHSQATKVSTQHTAVPASRIVPANLGNVMTNTEATPATQQNKVT